MYIFFWFRNKKNHHFHFLSFYSYFAAHNNQLNCLHKMMKRTIYNCQKNPSNLFSLWKNVTIIIHQINLFFHLIPFKTKNTFKTKFQKSNLSFFFWTLCAISKQINNFCFQFFKVKFSFNNSIIILIQFAYFFFFFLSLRTN